MDSLHHQTLIDTLQSHPKTGAVITTVSLIASNSINLINDGHINPLVLDFAQLFGYFTTIFVGILTIRGYIKNQKIK